MALFSRFHSSSTVFIGGVTLGTFIRRMPGLGPDGDYRHAVADHLIICESPPLHHYAGRTIMLRLPYGNSSGFQFCSTSRTSAGAVSPVSTGYSEWRKKAGGRSGAFFYYDLHLFIGSCVGICNPRGLLHQRWPAWRCSSVHRSISHFIALWSGAAAASSSKFYCCAGAD